MEKIIVKEKKYKYVDDGYKDVTMFVSTDGSKWKTEKECLKQDMVVLQKKKVDAIPKKSNVGILESPDYWYFPRDEEELEIVKYKLGYHERSHDVRGTLGARMWIGGYVEYGGDFSDKYHIVTLDQYKKEFDEFLSEFEINP